MFGDSSFNICYNENLGTLTILKKNRSNAVIKIDGKYGIEIWCDINNIPTSIIIPDAEIVLGLDQQYLQKLTCNNT